MAFPAGKLNYRYRLQGATVSSRTDAGEDVETWSTTATLWGGRRFDAVSSESSEGGTQNAIADELVDLRYRAGVNETKRLLRLRDASTLSAGINASVTTITIAGALKFEGNRTDYIEVGSEIMRVTAGQTGTTLTVERGVLGTTAASHSISAAVTRIEVLQIIGTARADEREDELTLRVRRHG